MKVLPTPNCFNLVEIHHMFERYHWPHFILHNRIEGLPTSWLSSSSNSTSLIVGTHQLPSLANTSSGFYEIMHLYHVSELDFSRVQQVLEPEKLVRILVLKELPWLSRK